MRSLLTEALKKISVTMFTFAFLAVGGKLVSTQSADANNTQSASPNISASANDDVIEAQPQKFHKKRYRVWNDVKHDRWCHKTFKSYSSSTGKFISKTGKRILCHSPYSTAKS